MKDPILLQKEIDTQIRICEILEKKVKNEREYYVQLKLNRQLRKEQEKLEALYAGSGT